MLLSAVVRRSVVAFVYIGDAGREMGVCNFTDKINPWARRGVMTLALSVKPRDINVDLNLSKVYIRPLPLIITRRIMIYLMIFCGIQSQVRDL